MSQLLAMAALPSQDDRTPLTWEQRMTQAVCTGDGPAIEDLLRERHRSDDSYAWLSSCMGRMPAQPSHEVASKAKSGQLRTELWAVPILFPHCDTALHPKIREQLRTGLHRSTFHWGVLGHPVTLFGDLVPLDWICCWCPSVLRAHLDRAHLGTDPDAHRVSFDARTISIPPRAPRLGFSMVALGSRWDWPQTRALTVDFSTNDEPALIEACGPLQYVADAIPQGIGQWLDAVHRAIGIEKWSVHLQPLQPDIVQLELMLRGKESTHTCLDLRLHQIGMRGVQKVLRTVSSFASPAATGEEAAGWLQ